MTDDEWRALLAERDAKIAELEARIEELLARLGQNSLNSSLPPSRDSKDAKEKRRERAAKHAKRREKEARRKNRAKRELLPPEKVTSSEDHFPDACDGCGERLRRRDLLPEPERIQKLDIPEIRLLVHEFRIHSAICPCCEATTKARRPEAANESKVGPEMRALLVYLVGRLQCSRRDALEFLADVLGAELSLGLISKIEDQVSTALEPVYAKAKAAVQDAPVVHADETSWSIGGIPSWLWVATTGHIACFHIDPRRGREAANELLGDRDGKVTVSDRWVAYARLGCRQICWAHLERNAMALLERGENASQVGVRVLTFVRIMFKLWHRFLDDEIGRREVRRQIKAFGNVLLRDLEESLPGMGKVARRFTKGLLKVREHLFTFTEIEDVEPTNNLAERDIRRGVMWRRRSLGVQSQRGARFVERMLTVVVSLRAQGRSVYGFLRQLLDPSRRRPSLVHA